jgi:uncharacterized protein (TIGR02145 family)
MKRNILLLISIIISLNIHSQSYDIGFAATGIVTNIDSVCIKNITQGTSVTLAGTDILHLGTVGMTDSKMQNEKIQTFPNPMNGQAELIFNALQAGKMQLTIFDISGKEILHFTNYSSQGIQILKINGLNDGMYILNIIGGSYFYTTKLISHNTISNEPQIKYMSNEKPGIILKTSKEIESTINMAFKNGDNLCFVGFSGIYKDTINDIAIASKTITFNFEGNNSITDIEGNVYHSVTIGTQIWLAENLKTTKFKDGTDIPLVTDTLWSYINTPGYCWYENNEATYKNPYGAMYNWYAVNTTKLCPNGWHVPNSTEWSTLINYLGKDSAGGKLKEAGTTHWNSPNTGATNQSGFTALPGGLRGNSGLFFGMGNGSYWWSATEGYGNIAVYYFMSSTMVTVYNNFFEKEFGFYVRCMKD